MKYFNSPKSKGFVSHWFSIKCIPLRESGVSLSSFWLTTRPYGISCRPVQPSRSSIVLGKVQIGSKQQSLSQTVYKVCTPVEIRSNSRRQKTDRGINKIRIRPTPSRTKQSKLPKSHFVLGFSARLCIRNESGSCILLFPSFGKKLLHIHFQANAKGLKSGRRLTCKSRNDNTLCFPV